MNSADSRAGLGRHVGMTSLFPDHKKCMSSEIIIENYNEMTNIPPNGERCIITRSIMTRTLFFENYSIKDIASLLESPRKIVYH